jgi:hypothetical protein
MPEPPLSIKLRYVGSAVEDGTMPIEEVILALKGFAGAYGKVAENLLPSSSHELRIYQPLRKALSIWLFWRGFRRAESNRRPEILPQPYPLPLGN